MSVELVRSVTDQACWAYYAGYGKSGQGLDAVRGARLDPNDTGEDQHGKPGEIDLEVGDSRSRKAWQAAVLAITTALDTTPATDPAGLRRGSERLIRRLQAGRPLDEHQWKLLSTAASKLTRAVGAPMPARPDPWCFVCRSRASGPNHAGRCSTCARRYHRSGKDEFPDKQIITPWTAKAEREKRGEGWGSG